MLKEYTRETFLQQFRRRDFDDYPEELAAVRQILAAVREAGDEAVLAYTERFDQARLTALEVSAADFAAAEAAVEPESKAILQQAAENIAAYHRRQLQQSWVEYGADGIILGQRITAGQSRCLCPEGSCLSFFCAEDSCSGAYRRCAGSCDGDASPG